MAAVMKLSAYRAAWRNNTVDQLAKRKWKPHSSTPYAADLKLFRSGIRLPRERYLALIAEYHRSPEWEARRILRFADYAGLCAGCDTYAASELHHNAGYKRLFEETLEELLPLCRECHEQRSKRSGEIDEPQPKRVANLAAPGDRPGWWCVNCQNGNIGSADECDRCGTPRTVSIHVAWKAGTIADAARSLNRDRIVWWLCPTCDSLNNLNASNCEDCGKLRPLAAEPW